MRTKMFLVAICLVTAVSADDLMGARTFLLKDLYFVSKGAIGTCQYWSLHMGAHECTIRRKFPGEDTVTLQATMNLDLVSSGYVTGSGYSPRGKVDCLTGFVLVKADTSYKLSVDSIGYAFDNLRKVVSVKGDTGGLRIDLEGKPVPPKELVLRIYHMVDYYGEKVLRPQTEVPVSAISFTKAGIQKALAEQKKIQAAEPAK